VLLSAFWQSESTASHRRCPVLPTQKALFAPNWAEQIRVNDIFRNINKEMLIIANLNSAIIL
jgi:hypothetical protein